MLTITCPTCRAKVRVDESSAGRRTQCPQCYATIDVPPASPAAPEINPYASPQSSFQPQPIPAATQTPVYGPWQQGNLLVMHKQTVLPDRCVKSNQPAFGRRLRRDLSWHHPAIYLTIFIHLLLYIILALILRKKAVIDIGLSEQWFAKRRRAMLIGWGSVLAGIGLMIAGVAGIDTAPELGLLIVLGLLVFLIGALYGLIRSRLVAPKRITKDYVWLKGVHPDFLAGLPAWPYNV